MFMGQLLLLFFFVSINSYAQTEEQNSSKEVGIRLYGLNNFDFIYKKQKAENKYRRLRLISSNLSISDFKDFNTSLSLGLTIGNEKRKVTR